MTSKASSPECAYDPTQPFGALALVATADFPSPHPRTVLWWQQREQCLRCVSCVEQPRPRNNTRADGTALDGPGGLRCAAQRRKIGSYIGQHGFGRVIQVYCIDARDPGQPCGPEARQFVERK